MRLIRFFIIATGLAFVLASCSNPNTEPTTSESTDSLSNLPYVAEVSKQILDQPENASLLVERAKLYETNGRLDLAYTDARKAAEMEPENADYLALLGNLAFKNNEIAESLSALKRATELNERSKDAWLSLAQIQYSLKKYEDAKQSLEMLTKNFGDLPEAYFINGMIKKDQLDTASAVANFQKVVKLDDSNFDAYMQLGLLLKGQKNPMALDYLNNAVRLDDSSVLALYARGQAFQEFGLAQRNKEYIRNAAADYNRIININPNHAPSYYNLGMMNFRMEKYEDALAHFNEAVIADESYVDAYYMRGLCQQGIGNVAEAKNNYEAALKLDPNYTKAAEMLDILKSR